MQLTKTEETARLSALRAYDILDTNPEPAFDDLTALASSICGTPIAAISLVDDARQWFKSKIGLGVDQTPRNIAFCEHAIQNPHSVFTVEDASQDERFANNPLVYSSPHIRFYAGVPLVVGVGHALGTLCVIDTEPRHLSDSQLEALKILSRQTIAQLDLRITNKELQRSHDELGQFAYRVSHDLKAPLCTSKRLSEFVVSDIDAGDVDEAKVNAIRINTQMQRLERLVVDILDLAKADLANELDEEIDFETLIDEVQTTHEESIQCSGVRVSLDIKSGFPLSAPRVRLLQIVDNLFSNSLKYHNPKRAHRFTKVIWKESEIGADLRIEDNGLGIPKDSQQHVFKFFNRFHPDRAKGSGLGLAIVKRHTEALCADIRFSSDASGTCFDLHFPKRRTVNN
ncbi:MAG: sensor histidine kinase [Pseudomonadales bacterium]